MLSNISFPQVPKLSVKSKIKIWLIELIWNKANLSNFSTFLVMVTGIVLTLIFERKSYDSTDVSHNTALC